MPSQAGVVVPRGPACPIRTELGMSLQEASGVELAEIRAYKLGKKRWSYNQVELIVCKDTGDRQLTVKQAVHMGTSPDAPDCGVTFQIQLANDEKVTLDAFLVYDGANAVTNEDDDQEHEWTMVDRCACQRGCVGPVLRAIQRFGKLGKRSWGGSSTPDVTDRTNHNMKDMRYMYLSFDEAGTHVGCKSFRLIAAIYDEHRTELLGTAATPPVRVLANNDVPTGAAHLQLMVSVPSAWKGWSASTSAGVEPSFAARLAAAMSTPPMARQTSRRSSKRAESDDDEPVSSYEDPGSTDAANTPVHLPGDHSPSPNPYRTRRSTGVTTTKDLQPSASPLCLSTGNSPSSVFVGGAILDRVTPPLEVASLPLREEGSLALWLEEEARAAAAAAKAQPLARQPYVVTSGQRNIKRPKVDDSAVPLPHSADFEPHFPVLLGPSSALRMDAGDHAHSSGVAHPSGNKDVDDPIAAFVELMMLQTQQHQPPVVELPAVDQDEHPVHASTLHQHHLEKISGTCHRPASPLLHMNLPEPSPSIATPTPSALEDLFAGIHTTFDGIHDAVNDDATFPPPMKVTMNPNASSYVVGIDAIAR